MFLLSKTNSIANHFLAELRDVEIQKDSMRFRRNMERLGEIFGYEISKTLDFVNVKTQTPLGISHHHQIKNTPILATILRAGLPLHQGLLNIFDQANSCFIAAYRKSRKGDDFDIQMDYVSTPNLDGKTVIVSDPMLATGQSLVLCCQDLLSKYNIETLHIVSVIASKQGVDYIKANLPKAKLWLGAIDEEMTSKSYIVPGLGDAGDLAFGQKV